MRNIVVVGSIHTDLVVTASRLPARGETILGGAFHTFPGGKGANQAVAASRLGGCAWMVGRVGEDLYGTFQRASLAESGVHIDHVATDAEAASGVALITVAETGDNTIVVAAGASGRCAPADVDRAGEALAGAAPLLKQLEIPQETLEHAPRFARRHGVRVILDPAPAAALPGSLLELVDILTPNETEAALLCGRSPADPGEPAGLAAALRARVHGTVIVTLGAGGALVATDSGVAHVPAVPVEAVDATAAGDTFNGALAVALSEGRSLLDAVRWANYASALAVTRLGAQASVPTRAEVDSFFAEREGKH